MIYGPLSDQYGRKPMLAAGLAVYVDGRRHGGAGARVSRRLVALAVPARARRVVGQRARARDRSRSLARRAGVARIVAGWRSSRSCRPCSRRLSAARSLRSVTGRRSSGCTRLPASPVPRRRARGGAAARTRDPASHLLQRIAAYGPILRDRQAFGYMACTALGFVGVVPLIAKLVVRVPELFRAHAVSVRALLFADHARRQRRRLYEQPHRRAARHQEADRHRRHCRWPSAGTAALALTLVGRRRYSAYPDSRRPLYVRRRLHVREFDGAYDEPFPGPYGRRVGRVRRQPIPRRRARGRRL